nr:11757_t:CDS:2 [Entrophospora candida]
MKHFLQLNDYLKKARKGKIVGYREKREDKKNQSLSPMYEDTTSEDIDKLLFQAKKISLKASKVITKKINSALAEYNNYEELATSLIKIIQESQNILKESSQHGKQQEYPYFYILQSYSLQKSQVLSKEIVKEKCEKVIADIIEQVQNTGLDYQSSQDYKAN